MNLIHINAPGYQHLGLKVEVFLSGKRFFSIPTKEHYFAELENVSNKKQLIRKMEFTVSKANTKPAVVS